MKESKISIAIQSSKSPLSKGDLEGLRFLLATKLSCLPEKALALMGLLPTHTKTIPSKYSL